MRIGFLGPFSYHNNADFGSESQVGAIEQQIFGLARELASMGHELYITRSWGGQAPQNLLNGVHLVNVNRLVMRKPDGRSIPHPFGQVGIGPYVLKSPKRLRSLRLDAVIVHGVLSAFVASIMLGNKDAPLVFVASNNDMFLEKGRGHSNFSTTNRAMVRAINRRFDATVALTQSGQKYLQSRGIDCETVIPNAVDPDKYQCKPEEGFILTAARLVPHKRIEDLLLAFSAVRNEISEDLVVIGSGPGERLIESLVGNLGLQERVVLLRFLPQAIYRGWLSRCSFFVMPSEAEAFGVTIIEAMASSKPVIARDIVGPRDIVTPDRDGYLFRSRAELENQIRKLSADKVLRTRLGRTARETITRDFTFKKVAQQYQTLLNGLCCKGSA